MEELIQPLQDTLQRYPQFELPTELALLLALSWLGNFVVKRILISGIFRLLKASPLSEHSVVKDFSFISRLSNVVPALIISTGIGYINGVPDALTIVVVNVCNAFVILTVALAISSLLDLVNSVYEQRPDARIRPIKGYIQVIKIVIYAVALILIIAALFDRSRPVVAAGWGHDTKRFVTARSAGLTGADLGDVLDRKPETTVVRGGVHQRAAVGHAAAGDEGNVQLVRRAREQDEVGHVVLARMATAFEPMTSMATRFSSVKMRHPMTTSSRVSRVHRTFGCISGLEPEPTGLSVLTARKRKSQRS